MKNKHLDDTIDTLDRELTEENKSEVGEVFKNLDEDIPDEFTQMSNIDFNARLTNIEITNCIVVDELRALGILPENAQITRQKKRLSVSHEGKGREEKVEIASASRKSELSGKAGGFFSKLLTPRN